MSSIIDDFFPRTECRLSKVEQLAGMVYGAHRLYYRIGEREVDKLEENAASLAVDAAEAILAECERRTKERTEANG